MNRTRSFALFAGAGLLATGNLLPATFLGSSSDLWPTLAATLFFVVALAGADAPRITRETVALGLLALLCLLRPPRPSLNALSYATAAVAFTAGLNLRADDAVRRILAGAATLLILYALYQRFVLFPEMLSLTTGEGRQRLLSGRVFSAFVFPAQFSAYLALILPLVAAEAVIATRRAAWHILTVLVILALCLAGSASGFLATACALAYLFRSGRRILPIALLLLAALSFVVVSRHSVLASIAPGSSFTLRVETWVATLRGAQDAPLLGHGEGSFARLYMPFYWHEGADEVKHPHSWPLMILFEHGVVGLAAWFVLVGAFLRPARDRSFRAAALAFLLASLLDLADLSRSLRALALFLLGASLPDRSD